jgi:4-hydroxybenzoate polyprenyltransferase
MLNPVCVLIFVGGCILETAYCLMWRSSHLRTIVSGVVKTYGAIAAVFAVPAVAMVARLADLGWLKSRKKIYRISAVLMVVVGIYFVVKGIRY